MASIKTARFAKAKISAVALANEKMEEIRNMPYDKVATKRGTIYPPGELDDSEKIVRDGTAFTLKRVISYVDDPYDGNAEGTISDKPVDLYPYDYKKVEISVFIENKNGRLASLTSNMAGKVAETSSETGIIKICVVDSKYQPVGGAIVTVSNPGVAPPVDIQTTVGSDGCIMIPNLPPESHNMYHLTATKAGFSVDMTYPRTPQNPNSTQPDQNVMVQQVTNQTLSIDQLSTLNIDVLDVGGNPSSQTNIHVEGTKEKWSNPSTPKYNADLTTDGNGHLEIKNLEFDDYKFTLPGRTIAITSPYQPFHLDAAATKSIKLTLASSASSMEILNCDPILSTPESSISISVLGKNISSATGIKIVQGENQYIGTNLDQKKDSLGDHLTAVFNLSNASVGVYDLEIDKDGETITQKGGFEIVR